MPTRPWKTIAISAVLAASLAGGCHPDLAHHRRITLAGVQALSAGRIAGCEEQWGEVLVSITDEHGDCHVFLLERSGVSRPEALSIIRAKQAELDQQRAPTPALPAAPGQ